MKIIEWEDKNTKLLDILLQHMDVMHACGGKGRCTTCKVCILAGMNKLTEPSEAELRFSELKKISSFERLSCQIRVMGNIEIEIPRTSQLPHQT